MPAAPIPSSRAHPWYTSEGSYAEIAAWCKSHNARLPDYVEHNEGKAIWDSLYPVWDAMKKSIINGLSVSGELPGGLHVERKAQYLHEQRHIDESPATRENRLVCAYAFAVAEENAAGGTIVTAPTCGACGVLPAVLLPCARHFSLSREQLVQALYVASGFGMVIAARASISGAEGGCQAEIGSAAAMAAPALVHLRGGTPSMMAHACAMAVKNLLGLVCDPVGGLVEVPCVKRNVIGAMDALSAAQMALAGIESRVPPDQVLDAMAEVGRSLPPSLRETGKGGLAATPFGMAYAPKEG